MAPTERLLWSLIFNLLLLGHLLFILLSPKQIIFKDAPQRPEAVAPVDLFTFAEGAPVVGDAYFVDGQIWYSCYFGCYLRLKTKPLFLEMQFFNYIGSEEFVTGLHVGEVEIDRKSVV